MMDNIKSKSIKKFILRLTVLPSLGLFIGATIIMAMDFGCRVTLITIMVSIPIIFHGTLYAFYKGLVRHFDFEGKEKLFFDGKF
jgi:hypothetical protein